MKKFTLQMMALFVALASAQSVQGQTTIESADMPVPTQPYTVSVVTGQVGNATPTTDGTWNYENTTADDLTSVDFYPETIPFFTNAGVDAYRLLFKNLNLGFGYELYQEFDFNANAIDDIAVDISYQAYTLEPFTGNVNDSIFFPAQSYIINTPRRIVEFPMTMGSSWSSSSRRVTDMIFNVPAFGLNNTPAQHAYTWVRHDTIVGWGKMRVYTPDGPSVYYDVLMDKISEYALDSFYLGGAPAPLPLLAAFGVAQGQKTEETYRYNFYRKGSFNYLASFFYDTDATFSSIFNVFIHQDDIETAPPSATSERVSYATVLYPNPSAGSEINIKVMGGEFSLGSYFITDAMGRLVQEGKLDNQTGEAVKLRMNNALPKGNYSVTLIDNKSNRVIAEQFEVIN